MLAYEENVTIETVRYTVTVDFFCTRKFTCSFQNILINNHVTIIVS